MQFVLFFLLAGVGLILWGMHYAGIPPVIWFAVGWLSSIVVSSVLKTIAEEEAKVD